MKVWFRSSIHLSLVCCLRFGSLAMPVNRPPSHPSAVHICEHWGDSSKQHDFYFKVTSNVIVGQIGLFRLTHIRPCGAWAVNAKCRAKHARQEMTASGAPNEGSLWMGAVSQVKTTAVIQAKPAGSTGAAFHLRLAPSRELVVSPSCLFSCLFGAVRPFRGCCWIRLDPEAHFHAAAD